jgi:hypothetical protein
MSKVKITFYHWDWKDSPEAENIQKALNLVFDGKNCPQISDSIPTANWDQHTLAISSQVVSEEKIGEAFEMYLDEDRDMMCWWDYKKDPQPLEI